MTVALRGREAREMQLDMSERIASPGPARERIDERTCSFGKAYPPFTPPRSTALVGGNGHRLDDGKRIRRQRARESRRPCAIVVGRPCHIRRAVGSRPRRPEVRPGTEVPGQSIMQRSH